MADPVNSVYSNMAGANDSAMNFLNGTMSKFLSSGTRGFGNMKKISDEILKNFKEVWKIYQQMGVVSGNPGSGRLGLGSFTRNEKIGIGAAFAGAALYDMMPNTAAAVTQRLSANTMVGLTGIQPNQLIGMANRGLGMGATSVGAPTQTAMALMYQGGMSIANPYVRNNIFGQIGGASAFSGMSNQDVATALSQVNSMNFLRTGTRVRNAQGDLLPVNQMINNLYQSMYSGRKITREQAAMTMNPYTAAYRTIGQVSGGNEQLRSLLTAGIQFRAISGRDLSAQDLKDPNKVFDILGLPKDDPQRAGLRKIFADNKLLEQSQKGLVKGYTDSLNASAALTDGFAKIASTLGPVYDGLTRLKGILQTFPNTGGVAGTLSSIGSTAAGMMLYNKFTGGGGFGAGGGGGGFGGGFVGAPVFNKASLLRGGAYALGAATAGVAANYLNRHVGGSSALHARGMAAAKIGQYALTGAAIGSFLPGAGTAIGATLGTAYGAFKYGGQLFSGNPGTEAIGGESGGSSSSSSNSTLQLQPPVPPGTRISGAFGPRQKAAERAAKRGKTISTFHHGLDYAVPVGTKIVAAGDGMVTETGNHKDYGIYVIINHGPKSTLYGHLSKYLVRKGQKVSAGDVIGLSGETGNALGPHLHFEVRDNGGTGAQGRQNPENFLTRAFKVGQQIVSSGINMAKKFINKVFGTNFSYSDAVVGATKWDFKGGAGLAQELSSQSIGTLIANAINSGSPLSYSDFGGATGRYKSKVTVDGKKKTATSTINGVDNKVSGDNGTMVGGNRVGLMKMLYNVGFRGKGLETAFAVALAESGGRANAHNRTHDYGLFQINMGSNVYKERMGKDWSDSVTGKTFKLHSLNDLYNPLTNAKVAYHMTNGGKNWTRWVTYNTGSFVQYLDDARRVAERAKIPVYHTGKANVPEEQLALLDKGEMVVPPKLAEQIRNGTTPANGPTNITVKMDVNIARASIAEAESMFQYFKGRLESELNHNAMGII